MEYFIIYRQYEVFSIAFNEWKALDGNGHWKKDRQPTLYLQATPGVTEPVYLLILQRHSSGQPTIVTNHASGAMPSSYLLYHPPSPSTLRRVESAKPIPLMRYLLQLFTVPGDLVFDVLAGLGSLSQAALLDGRTSVAIEANEDLVLSRGILFAIEGTLPRVGKGNTTFAFDNSVGCLPATYTLGGDAINFTLEYNRPRREVPVAMRGNDGEHAPQEPRQGIPMFIPFYRLVLG